MSTPRVIRLDACAQYCTADKRAHAAVQHLNGAAEPGMKLTLREALSLMGAHTAMSRQACMTDAPVQRGGKIVAINDRTCGGEGGRVRAFSWTNSYYKVRACALLSTPPDPCLTMRGAHSLLEHSCR